MYLLSDQVESNSSNSTHSDWIVYIAPFAEDKVPDLTIPNLVNLTNVTTGYNCTTIKYIMEWAYVDCNKNSSIKGVDNLMLTVDW